MASINRRLHARPIGRWAVIGLTSVCLNWLALAQGGVITVASPSESIQAAIDSASEGDTILVGPGIYQETINFGGKALQLLSSFGPAMTTIDGGGSGTTVVIGGGSEISGFTVTGGRNSFGAGMSVSGIGTRIHDNIFEDNQQGAGGYGAAIGGNVASPIIEGNIFRNNTSDFQFLSGVVSFVNSSSPLIQNNQFYDNSSRAINLTLPTSGMPNVFNNTIVGNTVGIRVDRRIDSSGYVFRNNVITNNGIGLEVDFGNEANNPTWENNLVFDNDVDYDMINDQTGMNGNISDDPRFLDPDNRNFRLTAGSAAIDSGSSILAPFFDFDGTARPLDGNLDGVAQWDIGAFEASSVVPEPTSLTAFVFGLFLCVWTRRKPSILS